MDTGLLIQYLIIAVAVLVSAWVVLKKQFPGTVRTLRGALALALLKPGRAAWLQGMVGTRQRVLVERGGTGHAENFAPVRLPAPGKTVGEIVELRIAAVDKDILVGACL